MLRIWRLSRTLAQARNIQELSAVSAQGVQEQPSSELQPVSQFAGSVFSAAASQWSPAGSYPTGPIDSDPTGASFSVLQPVSQSAGSLSSGFERRGIHPGHILRGIHKQLRIPCYKASAKVQLGRGLLQQCYLRQMEGLTTLHGGRLRMMSSSTVLGMTFTLSPLLNCLELPTRGRMSFLPICFTTFLHGRCEGCRVYWQLCWSSFIYAIESTHRRGADTGAKQVNGHRKWKESHFNAVMRALQRARKRVQLHGQTTYKGRIVTAADIGYPGQHHLPIAAMPETSKAPPQARDGMARILAPWPPLLGPCAESFSQPLRKGQLAALSFNLGGFSKAGFDEFQTWLNSDNVVSHVHLIYAYRRRGVPLRNLPVRHGTGCSLAFRSLSVRGWPSWSTKASLLLTAYGLLSSSRAACSRFSSPRMPLTICVGSPSRSSAFISVPGSLRRQWFMRSVSVYGTTSTKLLPLCRADICSWLAAISTPLSRRRIITWDRASRSLWLCPRMPIGLPPCWLITG